MDSETYGRYTRREWDFETSGSGSSSSSSSTTTTTAATTATMRTTATRTPGFVPRTAGHMPRTAGFTQRTVVFFTPRTAGHAPSTPPGHAPSTPPGPAAVHDEPETNSPPCGLTSFGRRAFRGRRRSRRVARGNSRSTAAPRPATVPEDDGQNVEPFFEPNDAADRVSPHRVGPPRVVQLDPENAVDVRDDDPGSSAVFKSSPGHLVLDYGRYKYSCVTLQPFYAPPGDREVPFYWKCSEPNCGVVFKTMEVNNKHSRGVNTFRLRHNHS